MYSDTKVLQLTLAAVRDAKLAKYFRCFNPVNMFIDRATGQFDPAMDFKKDYAAVLSSLWTMDTKINDYIMDPNETTDFDLKDIGIEVHDLPDDERELQKEMYDFAEKANPNWPLRRPIIESAVEQFL